MKQFIALLVREVREWRTVLFVLLALFTISLVGSSILLSRGANVLEREGFTISSEQIHDGDFKVTINDNEEIDLSSVKITSRDGTEIDLDDLDLRYRDDEWLTPKEWMRHGINPYFLNRNTPHLLLFIWSHFLRSSIAMILAALTLLSVFYLVDAVYKERADGSTYFYRSQPVSDYAILGSKLFMGTVGISAAIYVLGMIWIAFSQVTFPSVIEGFLEPSGRSVGDIKVMSLAYDWLIYLAVALLWSLPYAMYLLLVSAAVRSRPLLIAIAAPMLLGLLVGWVFGNADLMGILLSNSAETVEILLLEWQGNVDGFMEPGKPIELFGSFSKYIFTVRTLVSLIVSAILGYLTLLAYRRNFATS